MNYPSTFAPETVGSNIARINQLRPGTKPQWGKMNAGQMLAHLNVAYDMETGAYPVKNNFVMRFIIRKFAKPVVTGPKPYPKNMRTAPQFIIPDGRDFEKEKAKLIAHIERVGKAGAAAYAGKENVSFGPMTEEEWSVMYQKHLDHHLTQFGV